MNNFLSESAENLNAEVLTVFRLWENLLAREKTALGTELHQDVAQILTALRLDIALLIRQNQSNPDLVDKASRMLAMAEQSLKTVGNLLNYLQAPSLDQGLQAMLEPLCWDFSQRYALPCSLSCNTDCEGFTEQHSRAVAGIVQEALTNIARHAAANAARIICSHTEDNIEISVVDDGCGFDVALAFNGAGLGLQAMRWRAMALGGRLAIASQPDKGTQVTLFIPGGSK